MTYSKELLEHYENPRNVLIIMFDVLTTPLLIPIRIGKYYIKGFFKSLCKRFLKKTYHRLYDKE